MSLFSCLRQAEQPVNFHADTLHVYAAEVFLNEDFYQDIFPVFENIFNCKIALTNFPDNITLMDSVLSKPDSLRRIDLILGLDNILFSSFYKSNLFVPYEAKNLRFVEKRLQFDPSYQLTPISYSQIGFIYNSSIIENAPSTFGEMQDGIFKEKIIMINPRTSGLGRAMLIWSVAAFGENGYGHFWRSVKSNIYRIADNYDDAYNMFLAAQAPLLIGLSTTPVYHQINENSQKFRSTLPSEGSFRYYLAAGIYKSVLKLEMAQKFMEFLLAQDFQSQIPDYMWMYPVNKDIKLDANFELLPASKKDYYGKISNRAVQQHLERWISRWESIILD